MPTEKIHMHQSVARAVRAHGVDVMFGLMGDANLFMVDDYVRNCGGRFVPVAIEGSGVLAALGYAQVTGRVGVATATHGPGLSNCATALIEGARGRRPIVLLAGDTAVSNPHGVQSMDQRELVKATGAGFEQMRAPETAAEDVANAFYRARIERGPIVLNMPADFMWQETQHQDLVRPIFETPAMVPEGGALDEAVGMIASARRPIVLAGIGAVDARDKLIALAERLEAPLATTLRGKGLFDGHPADMGLFGTLSTPAAYEAIATADCVVAFGASLHFFTTDRGKLVAGKRVVQVTHDRADIGGTFWPDAALVADAGLTADNIAYWLDEAEIAPSGFTRNLELGALAQHPPGDPARAKPGCLDFLYALDRLDAALPADRILVTDGGRFMTEVWCRVAAPGPRSFVSSVNFGAIGQGLQEALGAAHAAPGRPVVFFTGDGGFMMGGLTEFNTAVRTGADLVVIVCNDAAYGAEHVQFKDRQMDPVLSEFNWPSFAEMAEALGGRGVSVASAEEFEAAIAAIAERDRPVLIELKLDPNEIPPMRR